MSNDAMTFDDIDLNGVVAAAGFDTPPSGQYIVAVTMQQKLVAEKRALSIDMVLEEVIELGTQHTEKKAEVGQRFNALTFLHDPARFEYAKRDLAPFLDAIGTQSINAMVEGVNNNNVRCRMVCGYNKDDYFNVYSWEIL